MSSFLFRTHGAVGFPVIEGDVDDGQLYSALDPARDRMLALFKVAINYELAHSTTAVVSTSPWGVAVAGTALDDGRLPVADTFYEPPGRTTVQADLKYPLLALWREGGEHVEHTLAIEGMQSRWQLHYILGPLKVEDERRLAAAIVGALRVVQLTIAMQGHPAYQDGDPQFFAGVGGLASVKLSSHTVGPASYGEQDSGMVFQSAQMLIETLELDGWADGYAADFEGVTFKLGVGGSDGVRPEVVIARTEVPLQETPVPEEET